MSTLFFEGFNIPNNNLDIYLDPKYWSKSLGTAPATSYLIERMNTDKTDQISFGDQTPNLSSDNTFGYVCMSGAKSFTNPPESPTYLQLSGISGLPTSSGLYIGMRVIGFNYDVTQAFPYAHKLITFCSGQNETLSIEAVCISGESSYAPDWSSSYSSTSGLGLRIVQGGVNKALYDLRMPTIQDWDIRRPENSNDYSFGIVRAGVAIAETRFMHLEFYIQNTGLELRIEGIETKDTYTGSSGLISISSGSIDNIKLYNRRINNSMLTYAPNGSRFNINVGRGECGGIIGYDDLSIIIESGSAPNYWVGETCRIIPLQFNNSNIPYGWPVNNLASRILNTGWIEYPFNYTNNILDIRDADNKYISASDSGSIYSMRPMRQQTIDSYMQKDIGGLRIFNEARKVFLNTSFINVYGTGAGTGVANYYEIGTPYNLTSTNYQIFNSFIMFNPVTNTPWVSGDIFQTYPGYGAFGPSGIFGVKKL